MLSIICNKKQAINKSQETLELLASFGIKGLQNQDLTISAILSIHHYITTLGTKTPVVLLNKLFLLGIMLISISDFQIYGSVLSLLLTTAKILGKHNVFDEYLSLGDYFIDVNEKDGNIDNIKQLEISLGINFREHFSFAITTICMKGLTTEATRQVTMKFIKQLLFISNKIESHTSHSLGYITALLPFEESYQRTSYLEQLFQNDIFYHEKGERIFLYQKYLFSLVSELMMESEQITVYNILTNGFNINSNLFLEVFRDSESVTQAIRVYTEGNTEQLVDAGLALFKAMTSKRYKLSKSEGFFSKIGFSGFRKHSSFKVFTQDKKMILTCTDLIIKFLKNGGFNETLLEVENEKKEISN
jgi:hypothetical protein